MVEAGRGGAGSAGRPERGGGPRRRDSLAFLLALAVAVGGCASSPDGPRVADPEGARVDSVLARGDRPDSALAGPERRPGSDPLRAGTEVGASGAVLETDVARLKGMGPVYTPFERRPILKPGDWLPDLLRNQLVPAIEEGDLEPDAAARLWVLVDARGRVADAILQRGSGEDAFDRAAAVVALGLQYVPALRGGERVPVWILERVSLLTR